MSSNCDTEAENSDRWKKTKGERERIMSSCNTVKWGTVEAYRDKRVENAPGKDCG